jgi:cell division protein ZapA
MESTNNTLSVSILNHEYQINCPEAHHVDLLSAADYLEKKMQETRKNTLHYNLQGNDRIAIISALNICHTLLDNEKKYQSLNDTLQRMQQQVEHSLTLSSQQATNTSSATPSN